MILVNNVFTGEFITKYEDATWNEVKNDIKGNGYEIYLVSSDENDNLIVNVFERI